MDFTFTVNVHVDRVTGKFISRDAIIEELQEAIESADPGSIQIDESEYETTEWNVDEAAKR